MKLSEKLQEIIKEESKYFSRASSVIFTEEIDEAEENIEHLPHNRLNGAIEITRLSNVVKPFIINTHQREPFEFESIEDRKESKAYQSLLLTNS